MANSPIYSPLPIQGSDRKKKKSFWPFILSMLLLCLLIALPVLWVWGNMDRLRFYFQEDKFGPLRSRVADVQTKVKAQSENARAEYQKTLQLLGKLIVDNPAEPELYFLKAKLLSLGFLDSSVEPAEVISRILFRSFIGRYESPNGVQEEALQKSLLLFRKAMALDPSDSMANEIHKNLAVLYFFHGPAYVKYGQQMLQKVHLREAEAITQLYHVALADQRPDWAILASRYPAKYLTFWKAVYYIRTRNYPKAWPLLNELQNEEAISLKNMSAYLGAFLFKKQRQPRLQLPQFEKIDLPTFLKNESWFFEEYYRYLLFYGHKKKAKELQHLYEKLQAQNAS